MKRRRRPGEASEHAVQAAYFELVALHASRSRLLNLIFAVPNGGPRSKAAAGKLKAEGVRPGVPDVCWPVPAGPWAGFWIEFKRPWSTLNDRQKAYIGVLRELGHQVVVCHEAEEAWLCTVEYMGHLRPHQFARGAPEEFRFHAIEADSV